MEFDFDKEIILQNDRVLLRPLQEKDLDYLLKEATADQDLVQFSPYSIHSKDHLHQFIQDSLTERKMKGRYPFVIYDKLTMEYAGSTSIANVSNRDKRLEIGWTWIGKKYHKTGLNRNCKLLLLKFAFETLDFERVELKADERNSASRSAIEKIGAKMEGVLRSHSVVKNGFRRNSVYYSILRSEWQEVKANLVASISLKNKVSIAEKRDSNQYSWGGNCFSWVLSDHSQLSVKEEMMPPGSREQKHWHKTAKQFFYVLKGKATLYINDEKYGANERQGILIPSGHRHFIANDTESTLEFLVISQPSTDDDRINC